MRTAEKSWREIRRFASWDAADALRSATTRDNPNLDVRMRFEFPQYVVEIAKDLTDKS